MLNILRSSTNRPLLRHPTAMAPQNLLRSTPSMTNASASVAHQFQRSLSTLPSMNTTLSKAIHAKPSYNTKLSDEGILKFASNTSHISSSRRNIHSGNYHQSSIFPLNTSTKQQARQFSSNGNLGNIFQHAKNAASKKPGETLAEFGIDLTAQAKEGKLDPVIGRHEEIRRTLQILARRTKNNPVLIGEPGVGEYYFWLFDSLI